MKKLFLTLVTLLGTTTMNAQEEVEVSANIDFLSHYVWRGMDMGGISIQPTGTIKWHDASLQLFGNTGLNKEDAREFDITLGYKYGPYNFGVTDYWTSGSDFTGRDLYFSYNAEHGAHQFEANVGYTCDYFTVQAYTMFWGNDFKYDIPEDALARKNGKRAFSTYIEFNAPYCFSGLDLNLSVGVTPFRSANTINSIGVIYDIPHYQRDFFYADGPTCVKTALRATKNFELGDVKVPVFLEFTANPYLQKAYFIVGMSIVPF